VNDGTTGRRAAVARGFAAKKIVRLGRHMQADFLQACGEREQGHVLETRTAVRLEDNT
jgi:hypothetical protein